MTKAQEVYKIFRDYLPRAESRYATIQLLKIWKNEVDYENKKHYKESSSRRK
jgi:hypothetical protein